MRVGDGRRILTSWAPKSRLDSRPDDIDYSDGPSIEPCRVLFFLPCIAHPKRKTRQIQTISLNCFLMAFASTSPQNNDIQILRAVAITLVVLQHYWRLPEPALLTSIRAHHALWAGVDVFLAISGFLMCQACLRYIDGPLSPLAALLTFATHRARRLIPALLGALLFSVVVAAALNSFNVHATWLALRGAIVALLGVSNFYWHDCFNSAINTCGSGDFNGVTWSLSLEWQLYAVLAIAMFFAGRRVAMGVLVLASIALSSFPPVMFSLPWVLRPGAFTLGCLVYLVYARRPTAVLRYPRWVCRIALIVGVLICVGSTQWLPPHCAFLGMAAGAAIALCAALRGDCFSGGWLGKLGLWIGARSYSIYLFHLPVMVVVQSAIARSGAAMSRYDVMIAATLCFAGVTALLSDRSYRFIEVRFNRKSPLSDQAGRMTSAEPT
ncbi:acyltransferase [Burkholderia sp. BCC0405]|uniref:acyltransferase family protein n=1 Tax=Burkholderia sp. BCC0405 TaxID=2676298 RepID=UPI001589EDB4|nr:acyltransferase [Burkholderia sp. BCC0405]